MSAYDLITFENGTYKRRNTATEAAFDFTSIRIGASNLQISESSGHFSFASKKLQSVANGATATDAATYGQVLLRDGTNAATANISLGNNKLVSVADPTAPQDAATKAYVDAVATGLDVKASVKAATTAALPAVTYANGTSGVGATLTADANGALAAQDGVTLSVNDRLLVKNQAADLQNGLYVVTQVGDGSNPFILTRATDADQAAEVTDGLFTFVEQGTTQADTGWVQTANNPITIGTTGLVFTQFSGAGQVIAGAGLVKTGNTIDVVNGDDSLVVNANELHVQRDAAGAIVLTGSGVAVAVDGQSTFISSNQVQVKLDAAGAIIKSGSGIAVQLESSNPTLQIASNRLGVKLDGAGAIVTGASGIAVAVGNGIQITSNAVAAKSGDSTIKVDSNGIKVDFTEDLTNDNASAITVRQIVYVKANGKVDLAQANGSYGLGTQFCMVAASSIAGGGSASGEIYVRPGALVPGFSSLTIGAPVYVSRSSAGGYQQDLSGFVAGEHVVRIGYAKSATEVQFEPEYLFEY